ncbi:COP9 signalosome complex subunit 7b isoform X2 [Tachyglossus aculeatus]|uniref:COP9 signalosome complex subunit 7b isoform X2 n=1 Tax=Tachyglossus aculeatus TaxID=9261 RepID=UPI0018F50159|nr:COP9 signalosome complex subunit 7b isoform X2 [Tachyglossus aculeatus]XP_038600803.1 COP9 signalosome complex subunit 7b isoform X2 [Tachyglossus aculeatus]
MQPPGAVSFISQRHQWFGTDNSHQPSLRGSWSLRVRRAAGVVQRAGAGRRGKCGLFATAKPVCLWNLPRLYRNGRDRTANKDSLPELTTAQKNKLKHLTIVSLAARMKCIPYSVLLKDLEMRNLRELEDLIIEAVYTDIIQGKLDQRNQLLEVDFCIGRDIQKKDISSIVKTLQEWCDGCEAVLLGIEQQVLRANQYKENHNRTQQQVETEVTNIKKTLKATASSSAQELEQQLAERECPPHAEQRQPAKKMSKVKGLVSSRH